MSILRGPIIQHKQGIELCYGGQVTLNYSNIFGISINVSQFSQLGLENFWLYIFSRLLKITQTYYKSPPKVSELKVWDK